MCFYQRDKVSGQVPAAKRHHKQEREPPPWMLQGAVWMKYSGQLHLRFSVAHVPMCVYRGTSQSMSSMAATNDNNHLYNMYIFIKKRRCFFKKKKVLHFPLYCTPKSTKTLKGDASCTVFPVFFSLSEKIFHYCLFTLD